MPHVLCIVLRSEQPFPMGLLQEPTADHVAKYTEETFIRRHRQMISGALVGRFLVHLLCLRHVGWKDAAHTRPF